MRLVWLMVGWLGLILGGIGAVLPIMPTIPFLIVAVWGFSRSSPDLRDRILRHKTFGPPIRAWQERGVITRSAKFWATLMMCCGVGWSIFFGLPVWIIAGQATVCAAVALFLITRPSV